MYNTTYYHAIYVDWLRTDTMTPGAYQMTFKREGRKKDKWASVFFWREEGGGRNMDPIRVIFFFCFYRFQYYFHKLFNYTLTSECSFILYSYFINDLNHPSTSSISYNDVWSRKFKSSCLLSSTDRTLSVLYCHLTLFSKNQFTASDHSFLSSYLFTINYENE